MTENNRKKPSGLIKQPRVVPELPDKTVIKEQKTKLKEKQADQESIKKINLNQQSNIKVSLNTKQQIDILLKFSSHKFAYELIDSMIDNYVDTALDVDQKRAFKTLSKLISE
jgi:uncharacterized protein YpiB (UPF0302 family)